MEKLPKAKLYHIVSMFARRNYIPAIFVAKVLKETERAVYMYGRGTRNAQTVFNRCCRCGLKLSHPGSIILGIGPECVGDWGLRDNVIRGKSPEEIDAIIGKVLTEQKVDCWVPKTCIKEEKDVDEDIEVPEDHKMLRNNNGRQPTARRASYCIYQKSKKPAVKIEFPFDKDDVDKVKTLPGREFHKEQRGAIKYWTCPLTDEVLRSLREWGFKLDKKLQEVLARPKITVSDMGGELHIPGLNGTLYPFQRQGVEFLEHRNGRALIADEMGLGKTIQALAYLQLHPEIRPAVILVPASLKLNWYREINRWMSDVNIQILSGKKADLPIIGDIIIINYDVLLHWLKPLIAIQPRILIIDECHYIKSNRAYRTKAAKVLGKHVPHLIGLSGTPIVNRPIEAFNILHMIDSDCVPSFWAYAQRYCNAHHNGYGWNFSGASNTEELHRKLISTVMIRRKKANVLKDLPPNVQAIVPMEISNEREYAEAEYNFLRWLAVTKGVDAAKKASNAEALTRFEVLKQLAVKGKMAPAMEWISDFIETGEKLVVFATHRKTVATLMDRFGAISVSLVGGQAPKAKQIAEDRFQNDPKVRLLVGIIDAQGAPAGTGLNLTAASNTAFMELQWSPLIHKQAADRVHRIGQTADSVTAWFLVANGTIEESIVNMLDRKLKVADMVLDGKVTEQESLLSELLNEYYQRLGN